MMLAKRIARTSVSLLALLSLVVAPAVAEGGQFEATSYLALETDVRASDVELMDWNCVYGPWTLVSYYCGAPVCGNGCPARIWLRTREVTCTPTVGDPIHYTEEGYQALGCCTGGECVDPFTSGPEHEE